MPASKFTTSDGIAIDFLVERVTLLQIRHWRESPGISRCEAWFQDSGGAERLWGAVPLGVQGRVGHRYRLCWARSSPTQAYSLVGARNLATGKHTLSRDAGLIADLFTPSRFGRYGLWAGSMAVLALVLASQFVPAEGFPTFLRSIAWWHAASVPVIAGLAGSCASLWRDRRDIGRSFDRFVVGVLSDDSTPR